MTPTIAAVIAANGAVTRISCWVDSTSGAAAQDEQERMAGT